MNSKFYSILLLCMLFIGTRLNAQNRKQVRTNVGLTYPLSSNWTNAPRDTNNFSLNILAGVSAAERRVTIAGLINIIHHNASGFQIAGFSNYIGQQASGTQVAGFSNYIGQQASGTQVAGFMNIYKGGKGMAIAGFTNLSGGNSSGQISGFMNKSKDVYSVQLTGFINLAKTVKGMQIAFINIADTANLQIGIINLSKNGEKSLGLTIDENQTTMLTFRSGGKTLYGILGIGYNFKNKKDKYAYEGGIGAHLLDIRSFRLNAELTGGGLESFKRGDYIKSTLRILPAYKITPTLEIFGGPSLNFVQTSSEDGKSLTKHYLSSWNGNKNKDLYGFYIGYSAGVQLLF
ncbi:hypothetical protein [Pedobacter antarcticus]|nr:hypothetical protein [Pedobacter antarcticus]SDL56793.1 hypothetical protein SAMN04488084_101709 [Pedobacter antarcticus]SFF06040.1 hypothetical protein SAMN03003324_02297 [Pedobacter antarcticus]